MIADVADPSLPQRLFAQYQPRTLVLNAGATPPVGSLLEQSWDGFSTNWNVDVRQAFNFTRAALQAPLEPGSVVISLSSGAALRGSPLSGGYAGAKATITTISSYAAGEAQRTAGAEDRVRRTSRPKDDPAGEAAGSHALMCPGDLVEGDDLSDRHAQ